MHAVISAKENRSRRGCVIGWGGAGSSHHPPMPMGSIYPKRSRALSPPRPAPSLSLRRHADERRQADATHPESGESLHEQHD